MRYLLLLVPLLFLVSQAYADVSPDYPPLINNGTAAAAYKITDFSTNTNVETNEGSFSFNKNTCSMSYFPPGLLSTPIISSDTYSVTASLGNSGVWNPVSVINNAVCTTVITKNGDSVSLSAIKSVAGAGVFNVTYTKSLHSGLKVTFSATNNNPAWTNYHIGMTEDLIVPQIITLGNQTFDLSQYNNTSVNRNWIQSHSAQLIKLDLHSHYDMGVGWNHANKITILWANSKAHLLIDYNYNTPILQPGHTITIDPNVSYDSVSSSYKEQSSASTFITANSITVGSHTNRALVAVVNTNSGTIGVSKVYFNVGGTNATFTKIFEHRDTTFVGGTTSVWIALNPSTGANTIRATFTGSPTHSGIDVYSLYNVDQTTGYNPSNIVNKGSAVPNPNLSIHATRANSMLMDSVFAGGTVSTPTQTSGWIDNGLSDIKVGSSYVVPTTLSNQTFGWDDSASQWFDVLWEIKVAAMSPTTMTSATTVNSTAITASWAAVSGAQWYQLNMSSPLGGTFSQIANQSSTSYTKTGLTPGTQYVFEVSAGNSTTAPSTVSNIKSNYTTNIAPTSLIASNLSSTTARVSWTNPSGNFSGFKIEQQATGGLWTTVVSNTGNSTNHRDLSGLSPGVGYGVRISTNYATGTNSSGTSSPSSILNFTTYTSTVGNITLHLGQVGDAVQLNGTTEITAGSPSPVTIVKAMLYRNGTSYQNATLSQSVAVGSNYTYTFWYQFLNANNQTFSIRTQVTNFTGLSDQTIVSFDSNSSSIHRQYIPDYATATTPALGLVNYTISRNTPTVIVLNANRDLGGVTFQMECLYQTASQAMLGPTSGTWVNKTSIGYWQQDQAVSASQVYYITCYDPGDELFHTSSLVNGSYTLFGISGFDNTFGAFLGVPIGVFFIVMAAALGNRRTAPMWVVIILAIAGMMATIGFFTLDQNTWYLAIIAGLLGLFVGRKLF